MHFHQTCFLETSYNNGAGFTDPCGVMAKQHSALEIKCQEKTLRHKKKHIWIISDIRYNNQILSLFSKIFQTQGR